MHGFVFFRILNINARFFHLAEFIQDAAELQLNFRQSGGNRKSLAIRVGRFFWLAQCSKHIPPIEVDFG